VHVPMRPSELEGSQRAATLVLRPAR